MSRVLTALQPSGILHIGNYFGGIEPLVRLQEEGHESFLFVVDYHAITVPQVPEALRKNILFATATYLAAGIDPEKTTLFQQSQVSAHTELAWILNTIATMGELERMTQFKDKSKNKSASVSVGLFDYPVLMAADILLYDTEIVPVGEDQKQHVELACDLAERFNHRFGETFVVPKVQIRTHGARIMGLDDPIKKMSKSASSDKNYLSLLDDRETVRKKIKSAVTDSDTDIVYDASREGLANLLTLFSLVTGKTISNIEKEYQGKGYGTFKVDLAERISDFLDPLQVRIQTFATDETKLEQILQEGSDKARELAEKKMVEVKKKIGVIL